jgi:hypothetical protein
MGTATISLYITSPQKSVPENIRKIGAELKIIRLSIRQSAQKFQKTSCRFAVGN